MRRWSWAWPTIIVVSAAAASVVTFAYAASPLRPFIVWWFLLVCPGMAFVRLLRVREPWVAWTLAIALSLALNTLIPMTMLYLGLWSPKGSFIILVVISIVGTALQLLRSRSRTRLSPPPL